MSALDTLINTAGGGAAAGIGGAIGSEAAYGIGELLGTNKRRANQQIEQQQKLTDIQSQANSKLMNQSYDKQFELWNKTQAEAQVQHLKEAGLNPALIYAKGGAGGSTSGSGTASVGGGTASNETERTMVNNQQTAMGLQLAKLQSEIEVNKSIAEANRAKAGNDIANTTTTDASRNLLIEKLKQDGKGQWLNNLQEQYKMEATDNEAWARKNKEYGEAGISGGSLFTKEITTTILNTEASTNNLGAQELLNNNKAQGYFTELLNETKKADAAAIQAAASKLSAEFNSGELQNPKYWVELGATILRALTGGIIPFKTK